MSRTAPLLALFLLLAVVAMAPAARVSYDPIRSGTTRLVLDKRFATFLARAGVHIGADDGAERGRWRRG